MTTTPPGDGSSEALRLERELRHRLHAVDALTPPASPDFAARAMAVARATEAAAPTDERSSDALTSDPGHVAPVLPLTRRRWPRVLVAAAAAVAIGAVAVPALPRLMGGTGGTASSGAAGSALAPEDRAGTTGAASAPAPAGSDPGAVSDPASRPVAPPPGAVEGTVPLASGVATGPSGSPDDLAPAVERLRARLTGAPYDALAVTLRTDPARVEIVLRAPDPVVLDLARAILPEGTPVAVLTAR